LWEEGEGKDEEEEGKDEAVGALTRKLFLPPEKTIFCRIFSLPGMPLENIPQDSSW
jgi:hypothetical protein